MSDLSHKAGDALHRTGDKMEGASKSACSKASDASHKVCDATCATGAAIHHKASELSHGVKADMAMEKAKDSNLPVSERVSEAATAGKERVQELFAGGQKEAEKEKVKSATGAK